MAMQLDSEQSSQKTSQIRQRLLTNERKKRFLERQKQLGRTQKILILTEDEFSKVKCYVEYLRNESDYLPLRD
jgi:hypothetical protein